MPVIDLAYRPREIFVPFHARVQRWSELICHRRAGKTVAAVNDLQWRALNFEVPRGFTGAGRFAFMAPTRVRAKDIAWQYLKEYSRGIPGLKVSESELFVEYANGGRVTVYGADNDRGMGLYLDGIVFDECDEIPQSVDDVVLPALSDRKGWTVHMGVLRGRHNLWKRFERCRGDPEHFQLFLRASESGILDEAELKVTRNAMSTAQYALQYEGDVNSYLANAIYGPEMDTMRKEERVRLLAVDRGLPLYTFWDIGYSDYTAIWLVQFAGRDILLHDYFCRAGQPAGYYAAKVREWEVAHGSAVRWNFLPHDAGHHDKGSGKTYVEHLREAGLEGVRVVSRTPDLWVGINALRRLMGRMLIDARKCSVGWTLGEKTMPSGIDCLDYYAKREDAASGYIKDEPVHDEYSHGASALRTMAEAYEQRLLPHAGEYGAAGERKISVLRGPGPSSYPLGGRRAWAGRIIR